MYTSYFEKTIISVFTGSFLNLTTKSDDGDFLYKTYNETKSINYNYDEDKQLSFSSEIIIDIGE